MGYVEFELLETKFIMLYISFIQKSLFTSVLPHNNILMQNNVEINLIYKNNTAVLPNKSYKCN